MNDGIAWGIFPILLATKGFTIGEIGIVTAIYPAVWGIGQLFTGKMADKFCKKDMLYRGMFIQAIALIALVWVNTMLHYVILSSILGWGTAMVYPTFLATVAENTNPQDRAKSIGIFRLWRDLGYAFGAILTGMIADLISINAAILFIGSLTLISAFIIRYRMRCKTDGPLKIWDWITNKYKQDAGTKTFGRPKRRLTNRSRPAPRTVGHGRPGRGDKVLATAQAVELSLPPAIANTVG